MSEKLSHEEFIKKAIISLRKDGYKGIHTVLSNKHAVNDVIKNTQISGLDLLPAHLNFVSRS